MPTVVVILDERHLGPFIALHLRTPRRLQDWQAHNGLEQEAFLIVVYQPGLLPSETVQDRSWITGSDPSTAGGRTSLSPFLIVKPVAH